MKIFNKKAVYIALIFLVATLFCFQFTNAATIGISPASIYFPEVLRGGYAERTVTISIDSPDPIGVEASTWGDASDWINVSERSFEVSSSNPHILTISVNPPIDIPNGNYSGFVKVMTSNLGEGIEGHAVGVVRSAPSLAVNIEIVDNEIVQCRVSSFDVSSVEIGDDIVFKLNILNQGNIRISPQILIDVWDYEQSEIVKSVSFSNQEILPTREDGFIVRVPSAGFELGQYWADISVLECLASNLLTFDILEVGALKANGILTRILVPENASLGETVPIEASFRNTGEKEVDAQFRGSVSKDGKIIQLLESPISKVQIDDIGKFTFYFTPESAGRYVVTGRVYYGGKKTFEKSATVEIIGLGGNPPYILVLVYVVLLGLIVYLFVKIRKERGIYSRRLKRLK